MKITLIGHAAILLEMRGATCLMDPVFNDPFEEDAVVSCPRRKLYLDRMPKPDIIIISHRSPDHLDIPSLAQIPRDCDAICPADPLIVYALKELGFSRVLVTGTAQGNPPDMLHRIAASALVGWIEAKKSFFYVRAYSRRYTSLYKLIREGDDVQAKPVLLPDLLMHCLLNVAKGSEFAARRQVDLQLKAIRSD